MCGDRLWAFERVVGAFLEDYDDREERNVQTKTECEKLCLFETGFTCRYEFQSCNINHKVRHPRCVSNKLDWSVYTCLTQLYGGIDMYNLLHKELHVSALFIGHLQVDK